MSYQHAELERQRMAPKGPQYSKGQYHYTANFCEENIWLLGKTLIEKKVDSNCLSVLILSNEQQKIPLFQQKLSLVQTPVIWDYHVILLLDHPPQSPIIFDFDSCLPFPLSANDYARFTFPKQTNLADDFHIYIREIPIVSYHQHFHSDRSHMLNAQGEPLSPFPPYEPILNIAPEQIQLKDYLDMSKQLNDGSSVYSAAERFPSLLS